MLADGAHALDLCLGMRHGLIGVDVAFDVASIGLHDPVFLRVAKAGTIRALTAHEVFPFRRPRIADRTDGHLHVKSAAVKIIDACVVEVFD